MDVRRIVEETLVPHTAFESAKQRVMQCFQHSKNSVDPICLALLGESRTGKSRVLEECEEQAPRQRLKDGLYVPMLRVKVPSNPTVKGFVEVMLHALEDPKWDAGTENSKTVRLRKLLEECQTRMLLVDEFQHFVDKRSLRVYHHVANWLKMVVDEAKVALVVAGLPNSDAVLLQNEQLSGRFMAPVRMPRFDWEKPAHVAQFIGILQAFDQSLREHFDIPELHGGEMAFRLWCATGGLMGYLTKLLRQLVWDAVDSGVRVVDLSAFERAHRTAVWSESKDQTAPQPFASTFVVSPTPELLAQVRAVGVGQTPEPKPRRQPKRASTAKTLSQVLAATGA